MNRVPRRRFGRLDLQGGVVGLGTVKWGRNLKLHYAPFELPSDATLGRLLNSAEELGINVLDTAPAYGVAEERLGRLLADRRGRFVVVTKVGEEFEGGESRYDFGAEPVRLSVERSLKRLRLECLDLVLLHCPPDDLAAILGSPALETLSRLKEKGWLRYFGVSSMTLEGGLKAVQLSDAVMVSWNYLYRDQEEVIHAAGREGKAVLLKKALLSGKLSSGRASDGSTILEACVASALDKGDVSALIAGTLNPEHLLENAAAAIKWEEKRRRDQGRHSPSRNAEDGTSPRLEAESG